MGKTSMNYYSEAGLELCFRFSSAEDASELDYWSPVAARHMWLPRSGNEAGVRGAVLYSRAQCESKGGTVTKFRWIAFEVTS